MIIDARHIRKNFGNLEVLKGTDLQVEKGEIIAIVGPSGAGKTTLLHILGTLDKPSNTKEAVLRINQTDVLGISGNALAAFRNRHIGFIFQFHHLLPEFNALENVCIPAFIAGKKKKEAEARASELLEFLELKKRMLHKPSELSGGEQQRVAVARALVNAPDVIFADEPSGNLDTESAHKLHKMFFDLRDSFGQTFVIVTHNEQLADMADRKITLVDGKIVRG